MVSRTTRFVRGFLLSYGPRSVKHFVWNKEFAGDKWNFINNTAGDCVYPFLEKYSRNGAILDLGCGPGNTANELTEGSYSSYLGVDIAEEALAKAVTRTKNNGRADKNKFVADDFISYEPSGKFDIILFRESMYHVPVGKVKHLLDRYSKHLSGRGVFVVRMNLDNQNGQQVPRLRRMVETIEKTFNVVEKGHDKKTGGAVIVFGLKQGSVVR